MATFAHSNIGTILLAIQARIMDVTELPASLVLLVATDAQDTPHFAGLQDVLIRPMEESRSPGYLEGTGRNDDMRNRKVNIYCRVVSFTDPAGQDATKLTDATTGLLQLEDQVANALQIFLASDAQQNALTLPMYVDGPSAPVLDKDGDTNWISSYFSVNVPYLRNLDLSVQ